MRSPGPGRARRDLTNLRPLVVDKAKEVAWAVEGR